MLERGGAREGGGGGVVPNRFIEFPWSTEEKSQ